MALFCDFQVIQRNKYQVIGDRGKTVWIKEFKARGEHGGMGVLMFMVAGLTVTDSDVRIKINGKPVGNIEHYNGADVRHWFSQIVYIDKGILIDGENEISIEAVSWSGATAGDVAEKPSESGNNNHFQRNSCPGPYF